MPISSEQLADIRECPDLIGAESPRACPELAEGVSLRPLFLLRKGKGVGVSGVEMVTPGGVGPEERSETKDSQQVITSSTGSAEVRAPLPGV